MKKMVDLTPELFVDLTLKMLPKIMGKLADAINKSKKKLEQATDPQEAIQIIFQIIIDLRSEVGEDLLPDGISSEDMENYKTENEAAIQEYLNSNPDVKKKWDNIQNEFQEKFESIMS